MGLWTYVNSKASGATAHPRIMRQKLTVCLKFFSGLLHVKANSKASSVTVRNLRSRT